MKLVDVNGQVSKVELRLVCGPDHIVLSGSYRLTHSMMRDCLILREKGFPAEIFEITTAATPIDLDDNIGLTDRMEFERTRRDRTPTRW